jgi:hypothetical protein
MPGTPPLPGAAAGAGPGLAVKLGRVAAALSVLVLGLALLVAPGAVFGPLLSTNAESVTGALLDCFVFGYIILQVWWAVGAVGGSGSLCVCVCVCVCVLQAAARVCVMSHARC